MFNLKRQKNKNFMNFYSEQHSILANMRDKWRVKDWNVKGWNLKCRLKVGEGVKIH